MAIVFNLQTRFSAEELFSMPSDEHFELIRGELRESKMPTGYEHGKLTFAIGLKIGAFVESNNLGECFAAETGFLVARDPDTVLAPDFAFLRAENVPAETTRGYVRAVPDLVLETRSPSDQPREVAEKVEAWLDAGVSMVLELNPATQILCVHRSDASVLELGPDDVFDGADILPGFTLPLSTLFPIA